MFSSHSGTLIPDMNTDFQGKPSCHPFYAVSYPSNRPPRPSVIYSRDIRLMLLTHVDFRQLPAVLLAYFRTVAKGQENDCSLSDHLTWKNRIQLFSMQNTGLSEF